MKDWGRIGRRTTPHVTRVVCDGCGIHMAARTLPETCPLCDGALAALPATKEDS